MRPLVLSDFHCDLTGKDEVVREVDLVTSSRGACITTACNSDSNLFDRLAHRRDGVEFSFEVLKVKCKLQNINHSGRSRLRLKFSRACEYDACGRRGDS